MRIWPTGLDQLPQICCLQVKDVACKLRTCISWEQDHRKRESEASVPALLHREYVDSCMLISESLRHLEATMLPPPSRPTSPELLLSDDEDAPPVVPITLRALPTYFPALPPKHTYLRTPVRLRNFIFTSGNIDRFN